MNENTENMDVQEREALIEGTEMEIPYDETEVIVEDSNEGYAETLAIIQQNTDHLPIIASDVRIVLTIVLLSFCWSCMRSWRINSMRGGKR